MNWRKSDFSRHYVILAVEGKDIEIFMNRCMSKGIYVRNVTRETPERITIYASAKDIPALEEIAGRRFKISISGNRGYVYKLKKILSRRSFAAGVIVFCAYIFYQSLFVTELNVSGYESVSEQELRRTMREAGLYEGCRKNIDTDKVKLHIYDEHDKVSWVGISFDGSLGYVTIAEGDYLYQNEAPDINEEVPCNIVASKDGYIEEIFPLEGVQAVEKGCYVRRGDILISGEVPAESTAYGTEEENKKSYYVHAAGKACARIPVRLNLYRTAYDFTFEPTGRKYVTVSVNDKELLRSIAGFENASCKSINIINIAKPLRLKIQVMLVEEIRLKKAYVTEKELRESVLNEMHHYAEENLPEDAEILNKSLNFTREKNIIKVGVTLETLQQIGIEEEIIIDNSNGKSEKDDDQ